MPETADKGGSRARHRRLCFRTLFFFPSSSLVDKNPARPVSGASGPAPRSFDPLIRRTRSRPRAPARRIGASPKRARGPGVRKEKTQKKKDDEKAIEILPSSKRGSNELLLPPPPQRQHRKCRRDGGAFRSLFHSTSHLAGGAASSLAQRGGLEERSRAKQRVKRQEAQTAAERGGEEKKHGAPLSFSLSLLFQPWSPHFFLSHCCPRRGAFRGFSRPSDRT